MVSITTLTVKDVLSGAFLSGSKKVDTDAILPFFILPLLLITSTMGLTITIIVMVIIAMGSLYVMSRPRVKNRSPFFFSWTISSGVTMYIVYQFNVLQSFKISLTENFLLITSTVLMCYFFSRMKAVADYELTGSSKGKEYSPVLTSDSHYCQICQLEVNERFFHSIWFAAISNQWISQRHMCLMGDFTGTSMRHMCLMAHMALGVIITTRMYAKKIATCFGTVNLLIISTICYLRWDCCVFRPNYGYYLAGLVFALLTLLFGTNFGLTTACTPYTFMPNILLPRNCDYVYESYNSAMIFVTCVYGLGYLLMVTLVLLQQILFYIPKYTELQWRKYGNVVNM